MPINKYNPGVHKYKNRIVTWPLVGAPYTQDS